MFLVRISIKKESGRASFFFCSLLFPIACFLYTLLSFPRDTLELLGQILIKRNIRYWLNTSLFKLDTHKGLKPWPNWDASWRKLKTWVNLRLRLARVCVHLRWLAMTCAHFGRDQSSTCVHLRLLADPFDQGLTVKIYIILVCTQQQWAYQVVPVGFCS